MGEKRNKNDVLHQYSNMSIEKKNKFQYLSSTLHVRQHHRPISKPPSWTSCRCKKNNYGQSWDHWHLISQLGLLKFNIPKLHII